MDCGRYIKLIQKALRYNYNIKATISTYESFNEETGRFINNYVLKVNGKKVAQSGSKVKILMTLKNTLEEAESNGIKQNGEE